MNYIKPFTIILIFFSIVSGFGTVLAESGSASLLLLPPFLGRPGLSSITVNIVAGANDIIGYMTYRKEAALEYEPWIKTSDFSVRAFSPAEILLQQLAPGTRYQYQLFARLSEDTEFEPVATATFKTIRSDQNPFSFALISDTHITPFHKDRLEVLSRIKTPILERKPEFLFMLGDNIEIYPPGKGASTKPRDGPLCYSLLRRGLGNLPSSIPVFTINGNWDGENGWHPARERGWVRTARKAFIPNPDNNTYPEGGSPDEDYYGFTWGNVLFLVLNVTGYTPLNHDLGSKDGKRDDWTLGTEQKDWLFSRLSNSTARWKLLFIHHTIGGKGGDDKNSRYGRGGGRAAKIGEQALIHQWIQKFGVQVLFYGHDHVFTDRIVNGIHYVCVGSAGAPWKFGKDETGYDRYLTPSGFTLVTVTADSLKVSFIRPDSRIPEGKVLHIFEIVSK